MAFISGMKATLDKSMRETGIHRSDESHFGKMHEGNWHSSGE